MVRLAILLFSTMCDVLHVLFTAVQGERQLLCSDGVDEDRDSFATIASALCDARRHLQSSATDASRKSSSGDYFYPSGRRFVITTGNVAFLLSSN